MNIAAALIAALLPILCMLSTIQTSEPETNDANDVNERRTHEIVRETRENFEATIEKLKEILDKNENALVVWEVKNGKQIVTSATDYKTFQDDQAYLVLEVQKGVENSEADEEYALLESSFHSTANIHREIGGSESPAFKAALERRAKALKIVDHEILHNTMFVITDEPSGNRVYLGPASIVYLQNDNLCTTTVMEMVYVYCGKRANDFQKYVAKILAQNTPQMRESDAKVVTIHRDSKSLLDLPFVEQLEILQFFLQFENIPKNASHNEVVTRLHQAAQSAGENGKRKTKEKKLRGYLNLISKKYFTRSKSKLGPSKNVVKDTRRLFLILQGNVDTLLKEKTFSLEHLQASTTNCIILSSKTVYVYCGYSATQDQAVAANMMANELPSDTEGNPRKKVTLLRKNEPLSDHSVDEVEKLVGFFPEFETAFQALPEGQTEPPAPSQKQKKYHRVGERPEDFGANRQTISNQNSRFFIKGTPVAEISKI